MVERPNTIAGLMEKRAEIAGQVRDLRDRLKELTADLEHIDATIRLFDPQGEVPLRKPPRRQGADAAFKGEMRRYVMSALRDAEKPTTSLEIAVTIATTKGYDAADRQRVTVLRKRVGACLFKLQRRGLVREVPSDGEYKRWELAR